MCLIHAARAAGVWFGSLAREVHMRREWFLGFGAFSTLMVLVGIDLALALIAHKGHEASTAILHSLRAPLGRR